MGCEGCFQSGRLQKERYQSERTKAVAYARQNTTAVVIYKDPQAGEYGFVEASKFAILHPGEFVEYVTGLADLR